MPSSKKRPAKGLCGQVFICLGPRTPKPPLKPFIRGYSILIHTERGGGVERETRLEGQQFTQMDRKIPTWLTISPVYKH
jgi:hypothetical protein